jgi:gas vesicle protein
MNKFGCFVMGGLIGALGALLLAPRSGQETRTLLASRANTIAGDAQGAGAVAVNSITGGIKQATAAGTQFVSNIKGVAAGAGAAGEASATSKNDELRAKIDAARARIAAQMQQSAAKTEAATGAAADATTDAVNAAVQNAEAAVSAAGAHAADAKGAHQA